MTCHLHLVSPNQDKTCLALVIVPQAKGMKYLVSSLMMIEMLINFKEKHRQQQNNNQ